MLASLPCLCIHTVLLDLLVFYVRCRVCRWFSFLKKSLRNIINLHSFRSSLPSIEKVLLAQHDSSNSQLTAKLSQRIWNRQ